MPRRTGLAVIGAALLVAATVAVPAAASASGGESHARKCARQFEEAQRRDMETFRDFEFETWLSLHDDDAITITPDGTIVEGIDNLRAFFTGHFTNREAVWSWTELTRAVDGCRTALIVYEATYAIPAANVSQRSIINVTYTYKHGRWLSVIDQGTPLPD